MTVVLSEKLKTAVELTLLSRKCHSDRHRPALSRPTKRLFDLSRVSPSHQANFRPIEKTFHLVDYLEHRFELMTPKISNEF